MSQPVSVASIDLPGDAPGRAYAWYVVGVLMLASTFSFLDRMIMGLLVGPIRETFQISDTQYSLLAGLAFSLFYAVMGLPLARIADSRSRRSLIAAGIAAWSAMTALCGLARGFWSLFLARVGVGVGEATLGPAAVSLIADYFPKGQLGRALSVYVMGVPIGSGLAYMLGGAVVQLVESTGLTSIPFLGEIHGWQVTFFIVGTPGLLVALLMRTVREPVRRGGLPTEPQRSPDSHGLPLRDVLAFLRQRRGAYAAHMVGISIFVMVLYAINLWGPTYLIRVFDYSVAQAGWTFGLVIGIPGSLGLLVGGFLGDAWMRSGRPDGYIRTILLCMLLSLPFMVSLGFAPSDTWGIFLLSAATFFAAFQGGLAGGALQLMTPNQMRAQVMAIYLFIANLIGLGLGPTLVAAITDFVFADDAAIGKSLALCGAVLCPLGAFVLWSGLKPIGRLLLEARQWEDGAHG